MTTTRCLGWPSPIRAIWSEPTIRCVTLNPVCQEELYNPGRDVSINPNGNSILTSQRPVPDVRLGYTSTRRLPEAPKNSLTHDFFGNHIFGYLSNIDDWDMRKARREHGAVFPNRNSRRPVSGQHLGLFEYRTGRFLLFVRRVAVPAQSALDQTAEIGPHIFT